MSVPNQIPYNIYTANGQTTVFTYEFYIISASDLEVSINGSAVTSGYTVSGVGNKDGGDITFLTPPANGSVVMLERVVPTFRLTDYQDNGDLLADTVNKDFDRIWMAIQRAFIDLGLALTRPLFGGPFNAQGYRIANLSDPVDSQDAATKKYVDTTVSGYADSQFRRTLRVPEDRVSQLSDIHHRRESLLGFNSQGNPVPIFSWTDTADLAMKLASDIGASLIGLEQGGTVQDAIKWVTPEMFGAVGDGVADDTDAFQAALDACVEYTWQGNVADTDARGAKVLASLMLVGSYRLTRTVIVKPYTRIVGIAQSYLGDPTNKFPKIIPDFVLQDGYAIESLNYDATGTHTAKVDTYSASASDDRLVTRCPGLLMENFSVVSGANTSLKGIFNLRLVHGSVLKSICARITTRAAVGANLTCTWNGAFRDCIFRTATIGLTLRNNVTTWSFDNCYFQATQGPNPLPWFTDFPEFFGYPTRQAWTAGVASTWSSPHFKDCTIENAQNGIRLHRCQGGSEHGTYFENIEEECYALMECVFSMTPGYYYSNHGTAATTRMVFLSGSLANSASIDMTNTNYVTQTVDPYNCPGASKLVVKHAGDMRTRMKIAYPNKVIFNCYSQFSGYCDVYISASGDDSYNGYSSNYPVKTLQEALLRCQPNYKNRIHIAAGNTVTTTTYYSDGFQPNRRFFQNFDIQVIGDATTKPTLVIGEETGWLSGIGIRGGRISFSQLNVTITLSSSTSSAATAFAALVYACGDCEVSLENCIITGSNPAYKPFLVSPAQTPGIAKISLNNCVLSNLDIVQGTGAGLYLAYILNHANCTFTSVTEGNTTGKIYSRPIA
ncbi:TPA: phage tail fiber protein [Klebsiella pneumoniae]